MVEEQIAARGVRDERVLKAMLNVERHLFVPPGLRDEAYYDEPLPIGLGQTISQPYIVAYMTESAGLEPGHKVLEIGTGSGYQSAVLSGLVKEVFTIEAVDRLAGAAAERLSSMGYKNITVRTGDGYIGWQEAGPFDAIIVTAAPPRIPEDLVAQLKTGGRMVIPVGELFQELCLITKTGSGYEKRPLLAVRFVPMVKRNPHTHLF